MSSKVFDLYVDYLIVSTGATTATGLSRLSDETISHDEITRMLSRPMHTSYNLWYQIRPMARQISSPDGVLIIDDSIAEKPHTDENEIICWHWDHVAGRSVKGINFLSLLYHSGGASLPISVQLLAKTERYIDEKTGKLKRRSPVTKNEYVRQMLLYVRTLKLQYSHILADSWYSAVETMQFIVTRLKTSFIFAIKSNRKVALSEEDKLCGRYRCVCDLEIVPGESRRVFLEGLDAPVVLARYDFTNGDRSSGTLYLVSNDTTLTAAAMLDIYKKRWNVEVYHKSLKQNASLCASPTRRRTTQSTHVFAALCAYVKLERLKLLAATNHFALKNRIYMAALSTALDELRALKIQYGLNPVSA